MLDIHLEPGEKLVLYAPGPQYADSARDFVLIPKEPQISNLEPRPPWKFLFVAQKCRVNSGIYSKGGDVVEFEVDGWNELDIKNEISLAIVQKNPISNKVQICYTDKAECAGYTHNEEILKFSFYVKDFKDIK